jgi:hypothetical protein
MSDQARLNLVAPCGIDCGTCELYICKDDAALMQILIEKGIPKDKIPCPGCRPLQGYCPVKTDECKNYHCVNEHQVNFCYECTDFPCNKLHPCSDRANILPHNLKIHNLCVIKRDGVEEFCKHSLEFKKKYYMGKMDIGNGPQL